jgi:hypothetical protein
VTWIGAADKKEASCPKQGARPKSRRQNIRVRREK